MTPETPRLRMFAGPNGSGKSVLKSYLPEPLLARIRAEREAQPVNRRARR